MSATAPLTSVPTGTWVVDPAHSQVAFEVKHMGIATVRGVFRGFEGQLHIGDDGAAVARGAIQVATVDTGERQRDDHLRSPDFFAAEEHPEITFESTSIEPTGDGELAITGALTLHGVTRDIVLEAEIAGTDVDPWGNERVGLEARGTLKRSDYEMRFNQALGSGNMLVADKVKLLLDVSAVKQA
jgi:polyisoprenoid-binding protein YceI